MAVEQRAGGAEEQCRIGAVPCRGAKRIIAASLSNTASPHLAHPSVDLGSLCLAPLHLTPPHLTPPQPNTASPHFTSLHRISLHPNPTVPRLTSPHSTTPHSTALCLVTISRFTSHRLTPPRLTSLRLTAPRLTMPRLTSPRLTSLHCAAPAMLTGHVASLRLAPKRSNASLATDLTSQPPNQPAPHPAPHPAPLQHLTHPPPIPLPAYARLSSMPRLVLCGRGCPFVLWAQPTTCSDLIFSITSSHSFSGISPFGGIHSFSCDYATWEGDGVIKVLGHAACQAWDRRLHDVVRQAHGT